MRSKRRRKIRRSEGKDQDQPDPKGKGGSSGKSTHPRPEIITIDDEEDRCRSDIHDEGSCAKKQKRSGVGQGSRGGVHASGVLTCTDVRRGDTLRVKADEDVVRKAFEQSDFDVKWQVRCALWRVLVLCERM